MSGLWYPSLDCQLPFDRDTLAPELSCFAVIFSHINVNLLLPTLVHLVEYKELTIQTTDPDLILMF